MGKPSFFNGSSYDYHYTTTSRLVIDDLTLKVDTMIGDLSLKSYSDRLMKIV